MNWQEYLDYTKEIITGENPQPPYDNKDYLHYTKMNEARLKRWIKTNPITEDTVTTIKSITQPQQWIVITEPWCGDAAHIVPIIYLMSTLNDRVQLELQLRDSGSEINHYLTSGSKSIPIFIVRNENGKDIFHWGPRPKEGQELHLDLTARKAGFEETINTLQNYYNADKSLSMQTEIITLMKEHI